ncbi:hypothetical protein ACT4UM_28995, partial [Bacillus sp. SS-TM]
YGDLSFVLKPNHLFKRLMVQNIKTPYLPDTIAAILKENVELQVLLMLFVMYGIFYLHYRRKLSA